MVVHQAIVCLLCLLCCLPAFKVILFPIYFLGHSTLNAVMRTRLLLNENERYQYMHASNLLHSTKDDLSDLTSARNKIPYKSSNLGKKNVRENPRKWSIEKNEKSAIARLMKIEQKMRCY